MVVAIYSEETERKEAELQLLQHQQNLQKLSNQLIRAHEEERVRLSRELHDELGQAITALSIDLSRLDKLIFENQAKDILSGMKKIINLLDNKIRNIEAQLRPGILDDLGLVSALEWLTEEFQGRNNMVIRFSNHVDDSIIENELAITIYRIFQEGLTNIVRHAESSHVSIHMDIVDDRIRLIIKDNGRGITQSDIEKKGSFGLMGMKERVAFMGGELHIQGKPGIGTTLTVMIPLPNQK